MKQTIKRLDPILRQKQPAWRRPRPEFRQGITAKLQRAGRWLFAAFLLTANLTSAGDRPANRRLIVGSELDFPPFALVHDGRADGFTVELWREVAREAHLEGYTIKTGPFHDILRQFRDGQIDVLINLAQSGERRQFADFSVPHVKMTGAIFVRKGDDRIESESDLASKRLIVINADLAHDYARQRGWSSLTPVDTAAAGMKMLAGSDQHDAMLVGRLVGLNTIKELNLRTIEPLPIKLEFQQDFAFAVRKGDSELLARINDGLANVRAAGAYDEIYAKWFGSLEPRTLSLRSLAKYILPALALFLLLLIAYLREHRLRLRWKKGASVLDATIESTTDGIIVLDDRGRLAHYNRRFRDFWQVPADLIASRDGDKMLRFVLDQLQYPADFQIKSQQLADHPMSETFDLLHFDGNRCLECYSKPQIIGSKPVGRVWGFRDVSERVRTEQALLAAEFRYRTIFEQAGVGVAQVRSDDGRFLKVNRRFCEIIKRTEDEMLSTTLLKIIPQDDVFIHRDKLNRLRGGEIRSFTLEKICVCRDQSIVWVDLTISPLWRPGEAPSDYIAVVVDITERKLAEEELGRKRTSLESLLSERTRRHKELRLLTQKLVAAEERERGRLAAELHDQIGQMLALAQIKLGAIRHEATPLLAEAVVEVRQMIDQTIRATRSLTMELGATVLRELGLVAALESLASETEKLHGLQCTFIDEGLREPMAEETEFALFRAARELIVNVIKHARAKHLEIALRGNDNNVTLSVTDDGVGFEIPAENYCAAPSGGFGLYSIYERMAQLRGTLRISSRPGAGTSASVETPLELINHNGDAS